MPTTAASAQHARATGVSMVMVHQSVHNAELSEETLQSGAGWTPTLRTRVDHPKAVPGVVGHRAGAGRLC